MVKMSRLLSLLICFIHLIMSFHPFSLYRAYNTSSAILNDKSSMACLTISFDAALSSTSATISALLLKYS